MNRQIAVCVGMSWWKRRRIAEFFAMPSGRPVFRRGVAAAVDEAAARGGAIAVWATREPVGLAEAARARGVSLVRVEDGFLRSVGLGSDFLPGASIVVDEGGIYFDPTAAAISNACCAMVISTRRCWRGRAGWPTASSPAA